MSGRATLRQELAALKRVFFTQPYNSLAKTIGTIMLVAVWGTITLLEATGHAEPPTHFKIYTALVFLILGRWWGIELAWQMAGPSVEVKHRRPEQGDDTSDDTDKQG